MAMIKDDFLHHDAVDYWPRKYSLLGVGVSSTTYTEVVSVLIGAARRRLPALVDFAPVSVLVEAERDPVFRSKLNSFNLVCPDGQPVRWVLNYFYKAGLTDRVCGTTTMLRLCEAAARENIGVYLYGGTDVTLEALQANLRHMFAQLRISGAEAPPFRPLTPEEVHNAVARINASGAGFLFVGIGSPKQESFVWEQRLSIEPIQLCVGAAFDFIAGSKRRAPGWMQKAGLEWLHRVIKEPLRLGKRYLWGNSRFLLLLSMELLRPRRR